MQTQESGEYRRDNFSVEIVSVSSEPYSESELTLSVTTNGHQWFSVGLTEEEAELVVDSLSKFLSSPNRPSVTRKLAKS